MGRIFRAILYLIVLGGLGLTGFAYLGDLTPEQEEMRVPVTLNAK
ncbi:MAG: hypothetical protein OIF40_02495 [Mangrovicoccus sp.]|nr:hypothetical protein [Mangrovicoccus sp.]